METHPMKPTLFEFVWKSHDGLQRLYRDGDLWPALPRGYIHSECGGFSSVDIFRTGLISQEHRRKLSQMFGEAVCLILFTCGRGRNQTRELGNWCGGVNTSDMVVACVLGTAFCKRLICWLKIRPLFVGLFYCFCQIKFYWCQTLNQNLEHFHQELRQQDKIINHIKNENPTNLENYIQIFKEQKLLFLIFFFMFTFSDKQLYSLLQYTSILK